MERLATRILGMLDDVRWTVHDIEYLGWQLVYQSPKPMQKRLAILADSIMVNQEKMDRECEGQNGLWG
jgi:hypothetical protein